MKNYMNLFRSILEIILLFHAIILVELAQENKRSFIDLKEFITTSDAIIQMDQNRQINPMNQMDSKIQTIDDRPTRGTITHDQSLVREENGRVIYRPKSENKENPLRSAYEIEYELPLGTHYSRIRHQLAAMFGALAKLTLYVVDSTGKPVSNAQVVAWFWRGGGEKKDKRIVTYTDDCGYAVLNDKTKSHVIFTIMKEDYYDSRWEYYFEGNDFNSVEFGRWLPWNPILEVELKDVREHPPMIRQRAQKDIPIHQNVGFDFRAGDLVSPHGTGLYSDVFFSVVRLNKESPLTYLRHEDILASEQGGMIQCQKDFFSEIPFLYEAPKEGFQTSIFQEKVSVEHKLQKNIYLGDNEYWIVKSNADPWGEKVIFKDSFVFDESPKGPDYFSIYIGYLDNPVLNSTSMESNVYP